MTEARHVQIDAEYARRAGASPTRRTSPWSRTSTSLAATPGEDINWLEDVELLEEDGVPAVFDRYSNSFLQASTSRSRPGARTRSPARCSITHLQSGNSYGIQLKEKHCKFPQPELGLVGARARRRSAPTGTPPVLEGWEPPLH